VADDSDRSYCVVRDALESERVKYRTEVAALRADVDKARAEVGRLQGAMRNVEALARRAALEYALHEVLSRCSRSRSGREAGVRKGAT
jgi:hypothetical protein